MADSRRPRWKEEERESRRWSRECVEEEEVGSNGFRWDYREEDLLL